MSVEMPVADPPVELTRWEQLLKLADSNTDDGLRLVFFAEAYFVQSLDKATKRADQTQNWHEIRLTPFTDDESRRYVAFRLAQAGLQGKSLFTQNQLSVIVGGSSGLPGRIDELASAILYGELKVSDERRWLPRMHRALVVLVLIGIGMGWLIFSNYHPKATIASPTAPVVPGEIASTVPSDGKGTLAIALPPANTNVSTSPGTPVDQPRPESVAASAKEPAVVQTEAVRTEEATPPLPAAMVESKQVRKAEPEAGAQITKPAPPVASTTAPPARPTKPAEAQHVAAATPPATESSPPPSSVAGKPRTVQWLRQQPAKYFTLQLFATANREKRDQFMRQQDHADRFATFETKRDGTLWYAVAYGSYATRAEATSAAASLPPSVGHVEPWIRTFASVQAIIE